MSSLTKQDYTIGWLCALPKEQVAAVFDEDHPSIEGINNPNFSLGRIDVHHVTMVCLPSMGPTDAARQLARLQSSFPNIRYVLVVGIAGGVPLAHGGDVRLGDIVVSAPGKTKAGHEHAGVVQYDFGTQTQGQPLTMRRTSIGLPADEMLQAVYKMQTAIAQRTDGKGMGHLIQDDITRLAAKYPSLPGTTRPTGDLLFKADAKHYDESLGCELAGCADPGDQVLEVRKERLHPDIPHIHIGLIASGNKVLRDAVERDRIGKETGALCFEMEAAGLNHDLKWLVTRGVSDYCDTHKNKDWQEYAAMVAASFARLLLKAMGPLSDDDHEGEGHKAEVKNNFVNNSVMNGNISATGGSVQSGGYYSNSTLNFG